MGLSKREFAVLLALHDGKVASQRDVAAHVDVSLGTVNTIMKKLHDEGLAEGFALTEAGAQALEPYKVDNAIIMAAGFLRGLCRFRMRGRKACCACAARC